MKDPKDEKIITISDPVGDTEHLFEIDREHNFSLVIRLIRKRDQLKDKVREKFNELKSLREKHKMDEVERDSEEVIDKLSALDPSDFDSTKEYKKKEDELGEKLLEIKDRYPQELIDIQANIQRIFVDIDRLGTKILKIILIPINGIPEEYKTKHDFIEETIADEQTVETIISFFLTASASTSKLPKELETTVKFQKRGKVLGDQEK